MGDEDQRPKQIAMVLDRTYCVELISHLQQLLMHLQANLFALEYGRTNVSTWKWSGCPFKLKFPQSKTHTPSPLILK